LTPTRRAPFGLLAWIAVAGALMIAAPDPPSPPVSTTEELDASRRATAIVVRDVKRWHAEHGDRSIPWDEARGHLAIVIDDVGRELHVLEKLQSLRAHLTFAVLPGSVYAAGAQLRLRSDRRRYREVLLHLPMEPLQTAQMHDGAEAREVFLLASDSPAELRGKLQAALERVPAAVGVNNHMGSRLTADRGAMDAIMPVLRQRQLWYLDSRTIAQTQAEAAAEAAGVPVVPRHVFLDNDPSQPAITAPLQQAVAASRDQPTIAIGHPSVELHAVLERELPRLHAQGIGIYPLSHVVARAD
jgi:hypothetical protein